MEMPPDDDLIDDISVVSGVWPKRGIIHFAGEEKNASQLCEDEDDIGSTVGHVILDPQGQSMTAVACRDGNEASATVSVFLYIMVTPSWYLPGGTIPHSQLCNKPRKRRSTFSGAWP